MTEKLSKDGMESEFRERVDKILGYLTSAALGLDETMTPERFADEIIWPLRDPGHSGDKLVEMIVPGKSNIDQDWLLIKIAATYAGETLEALANGWEQEAYSGLLAANFWCGNALGRIGFHSVEKATAIKTKTNFALAGVQVRLDRINRTRKMAWEIERKIRPPSGWTSRSQAAKKVVPILLDTNIEGGHKLSQDQAFDTVYKWLSEMPDAAEVFPKSKNKAGEQ